MTYRQRQARKRRGSGHIRKRIALGLSLFLAVIMLGVLSAVGWVISVAATAPDINELKPIDKGRISEIYAADGTRLGYVQSSEIREPIPWGEMPLTARQATVAIEDRRFYEHAGVDPEGIGRSIIKNVTSGKTIQGGSTITQQLVRALYIEDPQDNLQRKIREAKMAQELEEQRSKRWILREYMNTVPYGTVNGRTAIGIEAAAQTYFSKSASELRLPESALLAGLPQAPSQYNPIQNPDAALERRNAVIRAMLDAGFVTDSEALQAMEAPIRLNPTDKYTERREPYFFDYVQEQLIERYGHGVYRQGGLKVYTTIDPELQEAARASINSQLPYSTDPSSAVVSIEPDTGYITAMASSGTYSDRTFNLAAQGRRQPGSAFKTMVLAAAIRQGINPATTVYVSKPLALEVPGYGIWNVQTYDETYGGAMTIQQATLKSDNSVYAQLDVDVGPEEVRETAYLLGIKTKLDAVPSEGLGGLRLGVSPLEMANAYATLAAGGIRSEPHAIERVEFPDGKVDEIGKPKRKRVMSDGEAYEVTKILEQNIQAGTGTRAQISCPAAGKTGTTDNFRDAWFVGYTPDLATAVWVGYPNKQVEMTSVHGISVAGGTFPAAIWGGYMNVAKGEDCDDFPAPTTPAEFSTFYGGNSATGQAAPDGGYYGAPGTTTTPPSDEGDSTQYDPRLYAEPPQAAPETQPPPAPEPPPAPPPTGGTGGGGTPAPDE